MEITKPPLFQQTFQYSGKPETTDGNVLNNKPKVTEKSDSDVVTLSKEALDMLSKEQPMTPMFGGGTTLPPWPPVEPK